MALLDARMMSVGGQRQAMLPQRLERERGGDVASASASPRCAEQPGDVLGDQVRLEVDRRAGWQPPSVVTASVCGMSVTEKPRAADRVDGQADAVDGDRSLGRQRTAPTSGGAAISQLERVAHRAAAPRPVPDAVDVARDQVAAQRIAHPQRALEVDAIAGAGAPRVVQRQRLGAEVGLEPARRGASTTVRQTPSTAMLAAERAAARGRARSRPARRAVRRAPRPQRLDRAVASTMPVNMTLVTRCLPRRPRPRRRSATSAVTSSHHPTSARTVSGPEDAADAPSGRPGPPPATGTPPPSRRGAKNSATRSTRPGGDEGADAPGCRPRPAATGRPAPASAAQQRAASGTRPSGAAGRQQHLGARPRSSGAARARRRRAAPARRPPAGGARLVPAAAARAGGVRRLAVQHHPQRPACARRGAAGRPHRQPRVVGQHRAGARPGWRRARRAARGPRGARPGR